MIMLSLLTDKKNILEVTSIFLKSYFNIKKYCMLLLNLLIKPKIVLFNQYHTILIVFISVY